MSKELFIIAHNIRSAYNVGAIFRTADGMGASKIYLTGYSPTPHDKQKILQTSAQKMITKTALGAENNLAWEYHEDVIKLIEKLKKENIEIVALEQDDRSVDYKTYVPQKSVALILGNEPAGMEVDVIALCDAVIEIPMYGKKNSLNVAVAFGVAGYEICGKIKGIKCKKQIS